MGRCKRQNAEKTESTEMTELTENDQIEEQSMDMGSYHHREFYVNF